MYSVFRTARFDKEVLKKFSKAEIEELETLERKQLTNNPYVGDPLSYRFFREKKLKGKRVYFLIYDDLKAVLMIAVSDKKNQQETINEIKSHLENYYNIIREAIKQHDGYGLP
ncbi:MAG: hypothetical protein AABX39_00590 [Nanoarchaeota archaeon]